jgi:hypothetical protein
VTHYLTYLLLYTVIPIYLVTMDKTKKFERAQAPISLNPIFNIEFLHTEEETAR